SVEILRDGRNALADFLEGFDRHAGRSAPGFILGKTDLGPAAVEPVGLVWLVAFGGTELGLQVRAEIALHLLDALLGDDTFLDEPLGVDLDHRRMRLDGAI